MLTRFLYMLILVMDTNFRMKNRLCKNECNDEPLGSGWGYFVEDKKYKKHLRNYVSEVDVSTSVLNSGVGLTAAFSDQHLHSFCSPRAEGYQTHNRPAVLGHRGMCMCLS